MLHSLLTSALTSLLLAAPFAPDEASNQKKVDKKNGQEKPAKELPPPKRRVGRPGDLTNEEEDRLDRILEEFIAHDIGLRPNPQSVKALREMGPEAIPALIRALNRSAMMSDSCPVAMIQRKLVQLLAVSNDEEVLRLARSQIGSGVRRSPYAGLLNQLRVVASQREAQLARLRLQREKGNSQGGRDSSDSRYPKDKR